MAEPQIRVEGLGRLVQTLNAAGAELTDLRSTNLLAAGIVARRGSATAPRRSGRLAGSFSATATRKAGHVVSRLPYAAPIHWGWPTHHVTARPFLSMAAQSTETLWVPLYETATNKAINKIEGTRT